MDDNCIDRTLQHWVDQGVMLINASLSCDPHNPEGLSHLFEEGTHSNYWRATLMEELFQTLNGELNECAFVFMGQKAQYYNKYIDPDRHGVINTYHPVADYRMGKKLFVGSKVFSQINDYLSSKNKNIIEWKKN